MGNTAINRKREELIKNLVFARFHRRPILPSICLPVVAAVVAFTSGCGGGTSGGAGIGMNSSGNTTVTVLATSDANDQLSRFDIVLNSLILTDKSNSSANIISTPLHVEFMHVNGSTEPLLTASVPQGTYTSATVSIGASEFQCVTLNQSGSLSVSDFAYGYTPASHVTVDLPEPITVAGKNMGLVLDLLVSQSANWTACDPNGLEPFSITPTFNVTSTAFSPSPTYSLNGQEYALKGIIASVNAPSNGFTVTADEGPSCTASAQASCSPPAANGPIWQVVSNGSTAYHGVTGPSQLASGMSVDMDAAIQPDGSLLATRLSVYDTNASDLTIMDGPLVFTSAAYPNFQMVPVRELGPLDMGWAIRLSSGSAAFKISDSFNNLNSLPFTPSFMPASMIDGQNLYISTHALGVSNAPTYVPATTITLLRQTINGTVSAISSEGGFTTFAVMLAPYDIFPALAVQGGQTTLLTKPNVVIVYADSDTQMLNTNPITVGSVARFNGLIFNDNGTLRMDCAQINDGVAE